MTQQNSTEAAESKHSEMKLAAVFALIFSSLFLLGAKSATFTITNKCTFTIWPGILTGAGSPQVSSTGFQLDPQASSTLQIPSPWSGRVWARSQCTTDPSGKFACATADCGSGQVGCNGAGAIPPATLVEFTLGGFNGKDFYDISLVDGFNMPVSVSPQGGPDGCTTTSCSANVSTVCPSDFAVKGSNGDVIACKSACLALNKPEYCCTGAFGTPDKCPPNEYSKIFKAQCPQAYSYAYDDRSSTFTCSSGANYSITFCP